MAKRSARPNSKDQNVCWCNFVKKSTLEEAIKNGATSLNRIFDRTSAGVGSCGGSCRPYIQRMLDQYQKDGTFPENPRPLKKNS